MAPWHSFRALAIVSLLAVAARGAPPDFRQDVQPLLKLHCVRCHGPAKQEGKLNLSLPTAILRGGENGAAVSRDHWESSLLLQRVNADEMPPEEPLATEDKQTLQAWLADGAQGLPAEVSAEPEGDEHWAYQRLRPIAAPEVRDSTRVRNEIDRFVLARLEIRELTLAAEADRATLIRRVAFDLTGLPPTVEDINAFLADESDDAYEKMVDRYLTSPNYGERWGKYWLDAAGYADSNGYFNADTDRPLAYRYRDWVIEAVNRDLPFNEFLRQQLAGDEIAGYRAEGNVTAEMLPLLTATHFLRNSPDGTDSSDGNDDERRADKYAVLDGTLQIMGSALFGTTMQCARCHDHKFEPFKQREYYQLQATLFPAFNVEDWTYPKDRRMPATTSEAIRAWEEEHPPAPAAADQEEKGKKDPRELIAEAFGELAFVADTSAPALAPLLERGDYKHRGENLPAAAPRMVSETANPAELADAEGHGEVPARLAFANWITREDSRAAALLARVTVNRWWAHHFQEGIAATTENLGYSGSPPTHPDLLDYLAHEFVAGGWSAKALHRQILCSATYRQSSAGAPAAAALDADGKLLSRYPLHRLDAEAIRDAMLFVAGDLDEATGGPYVPTSHAEDGDVIVAADAAGANRRSVYLQQRRTQVVGMLDVFDAPSLVTNCTHRVQTTIPLQSLKLLNSDFVRNRAQSLARRATTRHPNDEAARLTYCFELTWGRAPHESERAAAVAFLADQPATYAEAEDASERAWTDFCQTLLASNAFLYLH